MRIYSLIEDSDNYLKTSEILWQYCRHRPDLAAHAIIDITVANDITDISVANAITNFPVANAITDSFKIKEEITGKTDKNDQKMLKQWYH